LIKNNIYNFSHARTALKYGLIACGVGRNDQVLLPSYICDVVIHPLLSLDIQPIYYEVLEDLSPDWDDLSKKVTGQTKGIVMVHYFGFFQDIQKFQKFCENNKILLIEDNAHGFGGTFQGQILGTFGQIGISSPRKSYQVLNGAYLYLKNNEIDIRHLSPLSRDKYFGSIKIILTSFLNKLSFNYPNFSSQDAFEEDQILDMLIDEDSYAYIEGQDYQANQNKREQIFNFWLKCAVENQLEPVFAECGQGCIPLVFPAYTASHAESKKWFDWGRRRGIRISSWPRLPRAVVSKNSSAMMIWQRLICFPIDLSMDPKALEKKLTALSGPEI
jgi:perosamine synthetase